MTGLELIGLLEVLRGLIQRSCELDGAYFHNFVEPAWQAFSAIHNNYKASLTAYADLLAKADAPIADLIDRIRRDSLAALDTRHKLAAIADTMPADYLVAKGKQDLLAEFVHGIRYYFIWDNVVRAALTASQPQRLPMDRRSALELDNDILTIGNAEQSKQMATVLSVELVNMPRHTAIIYLSREGETTDRPKALQFFEALFHVTQTWYANVSRAYHALRTELLA